MTKKVIVFGLFNFLFNYHWINMKTLIYFIILIFSNASSANINYINETLWNQIKQKISIPDKDINKCKLCYFLNIDCKYKDPR